MSNDKKKTPFDVGTFYKAPVKVNADTVTIELPLKVAKYFEMDGPVVYWAPVGGVIQLSGKQPLMVIPMLCANVGQFVPQRAAGDAAQEHTNNLIDALARVTPIRRPARPARRRVAAPPLNRAPMPTPPTLVWNDMFEEPECH